MKRGSPPILDQPDDAVDMIEDTDTNLLPAQDWVVTDPARHPWIPTTTMALWIEDPIEI